MVKMLLGALVILVSIALALVAILVWLVPEPLSSFEFWMLLGATVFILASGIFIGALLIEGGIRQNRDAN